MMRHSIIQLCRFNTIVRQFAPLVRIRQIFLKIELLHIFNVKRLESIFAVAAQYSDEVRVLSPAEYKSSGSAPVPLGYLTKHM